MSDYITLGSAPVEEPCVQVSRTADYWPAMRAECERYRRQLERMYPTPPAGCRFNVLTFSHDFGAYCEVVLVFDPHDEDSVAFAYGLEDDLPKFWDDEPCAEVAA